MQFNNWTKQDKMRGVIAIALLFILLSISLGYNLVYKPYHDQKAWIKAHSANNIESYTHYLMSHPNGAQMINAREKLVGLSWKDAQKQNTLASYKSYFDKFPNSKKL